MKLILHIGTEKTGTTTLQDTLYFNRDFIKETGVLYPGCFGISNHVGFCLAFQNYNTQSELYAVVGVSNSESDVDAYRAKVLHDLEQEIRESDCHTVIISNEHLHSRITEGEEIERIYNWASSIFSEIKVVCYLREQSELAISHFSTLIKSGISPKSIFPSGAIDSHYYNYSAFLGKWESHFSDIDVRLFERNKLLNGDIVSDFLSEVNQYVDVDKLTRKKDSNRSLSCEALYVLHALNYRVPFIENGKVNKSRRHLVELLEKSNSGSKLIAEQSQIEKFSNIFLESNSKISQKYFDTPSLFDAKTHSSKGKDFESISIEDVLQVTGDLWESASNLINFLEARNQIFQAKLCIRDGDYNSARAFIINAEKIEPNLPLLTKVKGELESEINRASF